MRKILTLLTVILAAALLSVSANPMQEALPLVFQESATDSAVQENGKNRIRKDMASLTNLYNYLEDNYLWDIDYDAVYDAMAAAMFDALGDRYTYYVKSEESDEYETSTLGRYGGLGFYMTKTYEEYQNEEDPETLYCFIQQVFPNSPAEKGGMRSGDLITHIDGESVIGYDGTECSNKIKGDVGTTVTLTIRRGEAVFDQTFVRAEVDVPAIEYDMIEGTKTGYIRFLQFYGKTSTDTQEAVLKMLKEGMDSLVIDLRDCPGGMVDSSLAVADMFIASSKLLTVHYKDSSRDENMWASANLLVKPSLPIVILINENSASAAEILAATMRDNGRAVLVGETTYGKGIMQAVAINGTSDSSVTVASFIPPSGKEIHDVGVEPDIEVPSLYVTEDIAEGYTALLKSMAADKFVDEHSEYTKENVELFAQENDSFGLPADILYAVVQSEYYSRMSYDERPVCDTWFDSQLLAGLDYLGRK